MDFTKVLPLNGHKPYLHSVTDSRHAPAPPDTAKKKVKRPLEKITRKTSRRKYRKGGCSQPLTTNSAYPISLSNSAYPISLSNQPIQFSPRGRKEPSANVGATRNKILTNVLPPVI